MTPTNTQAPRFGRIAIVGTLLLLGMAALPSTQAVITLQEDFEGETFGATGSGLSNVYTGSGSTSYIDQPGSGIPLSGIQVLHGVTTGGLTQTTSYCNTGQSITFHLYYPAVPTTANNEIFAGVKMNAGISGASSTANGQFIGVKILSTGTVNAVVATASSGTSSPSSLAFSAAPVAATWHTITISQVECTLANAGTTGISHRAHITYDGQTLVPYSAAGFTGGTATDTATKSLSWGNSAASPTPVTFYIDDVNSDDGTTTFGQTSWCSDFSVTNYGGDPAADFGYNYVEGVDYYDVSQAVGASGILDGFRFTSQSDNFAYMGKGWAIPGSPYAKVIYRIEASAEGHDSIFRAVFSLDPLTPSATNKGNGGELGATATGSFADHVEVRLTEDGSTWKARFYYSNSGSIPAQIGATVNIPLNPNSPHTFSFTANTTSNGRLTLWDEESNTEIAHRDMGTSGLAGLAAMAGGDPLYSQWFVTEGSSSLANSFTFLDDAQDTPPNDEDSTCIFWNTNVTVTGDLGATPPSLVNVTASSTSTSCDSIFCVNDASVPSGFTTSTFNFFLGLLLMISVAAGIWFLTRSPLMAAIGFGVGYLMGLAFGLLPLWPIVALVIIGAGILFIKSRSTGG